MGYITLFLGLLFVGMGVFSIRRNQISAGGRFSRARITGGAVKAIAIPQILAGLFAIVTSLGTILSIASVGQYNGQALLLLIGTYFLTNFGIGGIVQTKSAFEVQRDE